MNQTTLLDVVKDCDNFPYPCFPSFHPSSSDSHSRIMSTLWTFHLPGDPATHGLMTQTVVENMPWTKHFQLDSEKRAVNMLPLSLEDLIPEDNGSWETACTRILDDQTEIARQDKVLSTILGKKKGEQFPIVGALFDVGVDRSAIGLLGMVGRGAHMTVYSRTENDDFAFWIPQRDVTKSTYPGKLDQAVAGGVARGETPWECIVREAIEEAGSALSEEFVRANANPAGTVTWLNISDERAGPGQEGLINPGVLYVYDLELPDGGKGFEFRPVPGDIERWAVLDVKTVMEYMKDFKFKPSCAVVMIDFLVRHGVITPENEPDYAEIVSRLHRLLPLPTSPRRENQKTKTVNDMDGQ